MRLVLIGGGGHASDVLGAFEALYKTINKKHPVIGIVDDDEINTDRFEHRGIKQIGSISDLGRIDASHYLLAVGFSKSRKAVFDRISNCGIQPATIIHPRADIPDGVTVGEGSVILTGACISPMARVGKHVYLSHGALIGHDCEIHDFVSVMPGAAVSGDTILGEACLIGTKAAVIQGLRIGERSTVGAGAVVVKDVQPGVTVVGTPARPMVQA